MAKGLPTEASGPGTVVGVNVALTGTLKDQNDIVIHGMVDGEVISDRSVSIGQTAQVKGPVRGKVIAIAGVVRGEITADEKIEILETGKVYGSITTHELVVHSGAMLSGKISMSDEIQPNESTGENVEQPEEVSVLTPDEEE